MDLVVLSVPMSLCALLFASKQWQQHDANETSVQVMLHQPSGGANGMAADIAIAAEEIIKTRSRLNDMYAQHTGRVRTRAFSFFLSLSLIRILHPPPFCSHCLQLS